MTWEPGDNIDSWQDAEDAAVWHAIHVLGYPDARKTPRVDGGIDLVSSSIIGQVKREVARVGRPEIQKIVGARGLRSSDVDVVFYARSGYTRPAEKFALDNGVALFNFDSQGKFVAENRPARDIERDGTQRLERQVRLARRPVSWTVVSMLAFLALSPALGLAFPSGDRSTIDWLLGLVSIALFPCACFCFMHLRSRLKAIPESLHGEMVGHDMLSLYNLVWPKREMLQGARPSRLSARISRYRVDALMDELRQS